MQVEWKIAIFETQTDKDEAHKRGTNRVTTKAEKASKITITKIKKKNILKMKRSQPSCVG